MLTAGVYPVQSDTLSEVDMPVKDSILGIVRHAMTAGGGYFVGSGVLDAGQAETLTGAAVAVAGVIWSVVQKMQAKP